MILLFSVFEAIKDTCLEHYGLDPKHFFISPGLAWKACLKKTGIKLKLLTDPDMLMIFERGIRGGITQAVHRYTRTNNKYMGKLYDPKLESTFIQYLDVNNLYGWTMSQPLPTEDFEWVNVDPNKIDKLAARPNKGYIYYFNLTFIIDSGGKLSTRPYDKRDDFDFYIVNFPYLSSNIPSGPSYGVYISQLIRYARCCSHYEDFRYHHKCLVDRLLSQGYIALRLEKSFKKFYGRYQDLIEKYQRSVNVMVNDSFPG